MARKSLQTTIERGIGEKTEKPTDEQLTRLSELFRQSENIITKMENPFPKAKEQPGKQEKSR